jgi:hypothetical protein
MRIEPLFSNDTDYKPGLAMISDDQVDAMALAEIDEFIKTYGFMAMWELLTGDSNFREATKYAQASRLVGGGKLAKH